MKSRARYVYNNIAVVVRLFEYLNPAEKLAVIRAVVSYMAKFHAKENMNHTNKKNLKKVLSAIAATGIDLTLLSRGLENPRDLDNILVFDENHGHDTDFKKRDGLILPIRIVSRKHREKHGYDTDSDLDDLVDNTHAYIKNPRAFELVPKNPYRVKPVQYPQNIVKHKKTISTARQLVADADALDFLHDQRQGVFAKQPPSTEDSSGPSSSSSSSE